MKVNRDDVGEAAGRVNAAGWPCLVSCCRVGTSLEGEVTPMPVCTVSPLIISKCGKPLGDGPHLGKAGSVVFYIWVSNPWCHCPLSSQGFQEVLVVFKRVTGHGCGGGGTEAHFSQQVLALEDLNELSRKGNISIHTVFALEHVLRSTEWTPTTGNSG